MTKEQMDTRRARLEWVLNNLEVRDFDPYNNVHLREVALRLREAGLIKYFSNTPLVEQSVHTLLKQAHKIKNISWRDLCRVE